MTLTIYVLAAIVALVALLGIWIAQVAARKTAERRINALPIEDYHRRAALDYLDDAALQSPLWRALRDHLIAPFVLLIPLLRLSRAADALPERWAYWDNNVSINGDGWGWQDDTGNWHQCREEPEPSGVTAVRYSDPAYGGDAYYARGHHPRSWYARWIWLAWRNVACNRLAHAGPLVVTRPLVLAGEPLTSTAATGHTLYWNGADGDDAAYQWRSADRWGPLLLWSNVGAKLDVPYQYPEIMPARAMITATWRAIKL